MGASTDTLTASADFVYGFLKENLPEWAVYHSYAHTLETVEATREIAEGSKLNKAETEIVQLAAWFHDTGYTQKVAGHEEQSAKIAGDFLAEQGYPAEKISEVTRCILATKVPQKPSDLIEQVICDADLHHLGRKKFFERNDLFRMEIERREGRPMSDLKWLDMTTAFVAAQRFHTAYARAEFENRRTKNLLRLQEMVRVAHDAELKRAAKKEERGDLVKNKLEKASRPERGIETMFRVVPKNHLDLTAMADSKAHMIISSNSIIIPVAVGLIVGKLDDYGTLVIPLIILCAVSLTAIIFSILATRPKVTTGRFTKEDIEKKRANLLFFGNFHKMDLEDFEWGMKEMMQDREYLYGSMIRDLHSLGQVLAKKYHYLNISFNVLLYGFIISVIAFVVAVLLGPTNTSM